MKKLFLSLTFILAVTLLAGCTLFKGTTSLSLFETKEDVYAFSAVSAMSALSQMDNFTTVSNDSMFMNLNVNQEELEVLKDIEDLEPYLKLVETFMGQDNGFTTELTESPLEDYETLLIITIVDITGERLTYELHYNETITDQDEDEVESTLEGVLIYDGQTFIFTGEREVEEGEEAFEMTAYLDENNYVFIEYSREIDEDETEIEFLFELYKDGTLVKSTEIEFELEEDEVEMTLYFMENGRESEYKFEIETDGNETEYEIDYKITEDGNLVEEGTIEITITFDSASGTYIISYEIKVDNEEGRIIDKEYKNDFEADDNDDDLEDDDDTEESDEA
jgi:hypothetical protein